MCLPVQTQARSLAGCSPRGGHLLNTRPPPPPPPHPTHLPRWPALCHSCPSCHLRPHRAEQHARADVVTDAAGRQLRFCQQCTRLEPLANFTVGRRSCKASLAKRQARAHRGKGHSSPDSSPERGQRRRAKAAAPKRQAGKPSSSWSDDEDSATASGNGSKGSRRSAGGPASKRSRGSSPSWDAAPSHAGGRSPGLQSGVPLSDSHGLQGPPASLGSSGRRDSGSLVDGSQAVMRQQQQAAAAAAAVQWQQQQATAAAAMQWQQQQLRAATAQQAQQAPQQQGDGMDWCQYLAADELEELLAIDPGAPPQHGPRCGRTLQPPIVTCEATA